MILHSDKSKLKHVSSITHEGKLVVVATAEDRSLWYSIKQDGFEDSYLHTDAAHRTGWEKWQALPLPGRRKDKNKQWQDEDPDESVLDKQKNDQFLHSRYNTHGDSALAPVQLISGLDHLYVFRQSNAGKLLVDRFVLDGMTNMLVRKLEVRFKRSGERYRPLQSSNKGSKLKTIDSLDFQDANNQPFYEPTTELSLITPLANGWFSVVLVPTNDHDVHRWHIFAYDHSMQSLEVVSIRSSKEGLFDLNDHFVSYPKPAVLSGIVRHTILMQDTEHQALAAVNGFAATRYDVQTERESPDGPQLMREAVRIMVAIPLDDGNTAIVDFAVGSDGLLSKIDETPSGLGKPLVADTHEIILPLNTLAKIKPIGASKPSPHGTIVGLRRNPDNDRVVVRSATVPHLNIGDEVKLSDTRSIDGLHEQLQGPYERNHFVDGTDKSFIVPDSKGCIGVWDKVEKQEHGLVYDGMITGLGEYVNGSLAVSTPGNTLGEGDSVQVHGTESIDGTYRVASIDQNEFVVERQWRAGSAVDLKRQSKNRAGIEFSDEVARIVTPELELFESDTDTPTGHTFSMWVYLRSDDSGSRALLVQNDGSVQLSLAGGVFTALICMNEGSIDASDPQALPRDIWTHVAAVVSTELTDTGERKTKIALYRNGIEVASSGELLGKTPTDHKVNTSFTLGNAQNAEAQKSKCAVKLSDVQVWNQIRNAEEIRNSMNLVLTGKEQHLAGYWRLGGIVPGANRTVVDFSVHQNHATVYGDAFVAAESLNRHLDITDEHNKPVLATKYVNDDYFAVSQRASYVESFEFRLDDDSVPSDKLFEFSYWGKRSRGAETKMPESTSASHKTFAAISERPFKAVTSKNQSEKTWYTASCRFTVPDGINLIRSFGIVDVKGDWKQLHIRKHRVCHIANCITEERYTDRLALSLLSGEQNAQYSVVRLEQLERSQGALLREKRHLEMVLCDTRWEKLIAEKKKKIVEQRQLVKDTNSTFNYWSEEWRRSSLLVELFEDDYYDGSTKTFPIGRYSLAGSSWDDAMTSIKVPNGLVATLYQTADWGGRTMVVTGNNTNVGHSNDFNDRLSALEISTVNGNQNAATIQSLQHQWALKSAQRTNKLYALTHELTRLESERDADRSGLRERLNKVKTNLDSLTGDYNKYSDKVVQGVLAEQKQIHKMPALHKDASGLTTTGARLGFARSASRINAMETCEGNVQLSYFDTSGFMCFPRYDATADSRNGQFEQWISNDLRSCINFNLTSGAAQLSDRARIATSKSWSIEAWVCLPLAESDDQGGDRHPAYWRSLASSEDGQDGYLVTRYDPVNDTEQLGVRVNGVFESCGYDLTHVSDGWHHIGVTANQGAARFYIDGEPVGAYPEQDKLDKVKELEQTSKPNAVKLADLQEQLASLDTPVAAGAKADKKRKEDLKQQINKLNKKPTIKSQANAITKARAAAKARQPQQPITKIGCSASSDSKPFGKVAELRIWNLALTDTEIESNSKTWLSGSEPGLVAYYPMNEAQGSEIRDVSGNQHNLQHTNPVWCGCAAPIGQVFKERWGGLHFDGRRSLGAVESGLGELDEFFTVEMWLWPEKPVSDIGVIVELFGCLVYYRKRDGLIQLQIQGISSAIPVRADRWFHLAISIGYEDDYEVDEDSDEEDDSIADNYRIRVYIDGIEVAKARAPEQFDSDGYDIGIGCFQGSLKSGSNQGDGFNGQLSDLRIWDGTRSGQDILRHMHTELSGKESDLMACWRFDQLPANIEAKQNHEFNDITNSYKAILRHVSLATGNSESRDIELASTEYSTIGRGSTNGGGNAIMRRGFMFPVSNGIETLMDKRVDELELVWVGNSQFAPTLLGYIEGAPPVPGENLTKKADYNDATSVTLSTSNDMAYSWNRSDDSSIGSKVKVFAGVAGGTYAGVGVEEEVEKHRSGFAGEMKVDYSMLNSSHIASSSAINTKDSLSLRGTTEQVPEFAHLGKRFVPKNVGYALVVSALADVFISRLRRSRKMIGYQVVPVEDIPPDINTITFLINPAYTLSGSLDGLIGNSAASERFYEHVPAMRAQLGSQYPASSFRLSEAYDLKQQIDVQDKNRAAYFANYNSRLVDTASLSRETNSGDEPGVVGVHRVVNNKTDADKSAEDKANDDKKRTEELEAAGKANVSRQSVAVAEKRKKIDAQMADTDKRAHAHASLAHWQKKMEDIKIRAGKRNIVNNYVWDADGGMRAEAQSFANVAEHTIGGSFSYEAAGGGEGKFQAGVEVELTAQAVGKLSQTMAKTQNQSQGFSLDIDLSGVESTGVTDSDDYPLMPGIKVDRYRFMSFYLEGSTRNFNDFFDYVVDPEWLISNDEEARALRQAQGKANKTWRVLHRVTYVERPALMGFGRDMRQLSTPDDQADSQKIITEIEQLKAKNQNMQDKLDQILAALAHPQEKAP